MGCERASFMIAVKVWLGSRSENSAERHRTHPPRIGIQDIADRVRTPIAAVDRTDALEPHAVDHRFVVDMKMAEYPATGAMG